MLLWQKKKKKKFQIYGKLKKNTGTVKFVWL